MKTMIISNNPKSIELLISNIKGTHEFMVYASKDEARKINTFWDTSLKHRKKHDESIIRILKSFGAFPSISDIHALVPESRQMGQILYQGPTGERVWIPVIHHHASKYD